MNYTNQDPNLIKPSNYDSATFSIDIVSMITTTVSGTTDVVQKVRYEVRAEIDGQYTTHESEILFTDDELGLQPTFVPYNNLTKDQIIEWVESKAPLQSIHYSLCNRFIKPVPETTKPLPWSN